MQLNRRQSQNRSMSGEHLASPAISCLSCEPAHYKNITYHWRVKEQNGRRLAVYCCHSFAAVKQLRQLLLANVRQQVVQVVSPFTGYIDV